MVHGLEKFKEYFANHTGQYIFIGGTACAILLEEMGGEFRATKDLDTVLLMEEVDATFGAQFWAFIEDGGYSHHQRDGKNQFYRFSHPQNEAFPFMVELFSRKPDGLMLKPGIALTPVPMEESIASLSAILLDEGYYKALLDGKHIVDGYSVLSIEYLMLFKMKAWLDLSSRRGQGEHVDSRNIRKHRNDVIRLFTFVDPATRIGVNNILYSDVCSFIEKMQEETIDLVSLNIRGLKKKELLQRLNNIYQSTG